MKKEWPESGSTVILKLHGEEPMNRPKGRDSFTETRTSVIAPASKYAFIFQNINPVAKWQRDVGGSFINISAKLLTV